MASILPYHDILLLLGIILVSGGIAFILVYPRDLLCLLISLELFLFGAGTTYVSLLWSTGNVNAWIFVYYIVTFSTAELAAGLSILAHIYTKKGLTFFDFFDRLRG